MKKAVLYTSRYYQNNRVFDLNDTIINRDNCLYQYFLLKERLASREYDLATSDINNLNEAHFVIHNEMPVVMDKSIFLNKNNFLLIWESELIRPDNWIKENHKYFKKIFTWNDQWVDGKRYIKFHWPNKIPENLDFDIIKKNKLCTMIAGNKTMKHSLELYTERVNAIRWFEQHHPGEFDLYGIGWDKYVFSGSKIIRGLNRIKPLTRLLAPKYPSYKGSIESKAQILKDYKFVICYENAKEIPGYITEKIFDCFFAGCVPIYWGAPNIADFIPTSTFIDKENFKSYEELYKYIKTMSISEYQEYLTAIEKFVKSDAMYLFSAENFAELITAEITGSLT